MPLENSYIKKWIYLGISYKHSHTHLHTNVHSFTHIHTHTHAPPIKPYNANDCYYWIFHTYTRTHIPPIPTPYPAMFITRLTLCRMLETLRCHMTCEQHGEGWCNFCSFRCTTFVSIAFQLFGNVKLYAKIAPLFHLYLSSCLPYIRSVCVAPYDQRWVSPEVYEGRQSLFSKTCRVKIVGRWSRREGVGSETFNKNI